MGQSTCSVDECNKVVECRALCPMHYQRWRKFGDVHKVTLPQERKPPRRPEKSSCPTEECNRTRQETPYCRRCMKRYKRHGDTNINLSPKDLPVGERFWGKVDATGVCWEWTGILEQGYGNIAVNGSRVKAHRWAWESLVSPIPEGMVLDHLCRNRSCVLPDHLEVVTPGENTRRGHRALSLRNKTHCPKGHPYSGTNVAVNGNGSRYCRKCRYIAYHLKKDQKGSA